VSFDDPYVYPASRVLRNKLGPMADEIARVARR
jgi:hypothetical protein